MYRPYPAWGGVDNDVPIYAPMTTPQSASPQRLRDIGAYFSAAFSTLRHRGGPIVSIAVGVWLIAGAVMAALVVLTVDSARMLAVLRESSTLSNEAIGDSGIYVGSSASGLSVDEFLSGEWLNFGWGGLIAAVVLATLCYFYASGVCSVAITDQAFRWTFLGEKARVGSSLLWGLKRGLPAFVYLVVLSLVGIILIFGFAALGGFAGYAIGLSTSSSFWGVVLMVLGVVVGAVVGVAFFFWFYVVFSVSPYAIALSDSPWKGMLISARLTKRSRWALWGRIILTLILVAVTLSVVSLPLDVMSAVLPSVAPSITTLAALLILRMLISALGSALSVSSLATTYVDLGGSTPHAIRSPQSQR